MFEYSVRVPTEPTSLPPIEPWLKNPIVYSEAGREAYITLREPPGGWPRVFQVQGSVKCIVCDGIADKAVVCSECARAIVVIRSANFTDRLLELLDNGRFLLILKIMEDVTDEVIAEWMVRNLHGD